jgi:hypothetical protein
VKNDCARADYRVVADLNGAEQDRVRADIDIVSDGRTVRGAIPRANRCAMPKGAIPTEDCGFMNDQPCPMIKSQAGPDLRFKIEFDAKSPFHLEHVQGHDRSSEPAKRRSRSLNRLRGAVEQQRAAALPIPGVGLPILKDSRFHLRSEVSWSFIFIFRKGIFRTLTGRKPGGPEKSPGLRKAARSHVHNAGFFRPGLLWNEVAFRRISLTRCHRRACW